MVSKQPENVVLLAFHFAGKWNKNKFSGHIHSMPINLFNFAWVNFHCAPRHFSPVLSTPVSLVSTQQSRSPDPEPRRIWKEAGFSFPLTGKQGLKCVYCPHAQYSGYEAAQGIHWAARSHLHAHPSMCASVFPLIYNWNTVHRFLTLFSNLPSHGVQMSDRAGDTAWGNAILHPSDTWHPQTWALPHSPEESALAKLLDNQVQKRQSLITLCLK